MAGLKFRYEVDQATPVDSPIADDVARRPAGGLRFRYEVEREQQQAQPQQQLDPNQGDFSRGFGIAIDQAKQTYYGAKGLAGAAVGSDEMRDEGLAEYNRRGKEIAARSKESDSFSNVLESGDLGDAIDFLQYGAGYVTAQAGMALGSMATGNVAGGLASLFGRGAIKKGVQKYAEKRLKEKVEKDGLEAATKSAFRELGAAAALMSYNLTTTGGSIYGEAVQEQLDKGGNIDDVDLLRVAGATVLSAGLETWMDKLNVKGLGKALSGSSKSDAGLIRRVATEAFASGVREAGTELIQTGIERWGAAKELTTADAMREYVDSAALGFIGGGMIGSVKGAVTQRPEPAADLPPAPAPEADAPVQQPGPMTTVGSNILVTPELREKFQEDLVARGIDPEGPEADQAIKALEAVERATGIIRRRFAEEERAARQKEVEAAFGDTATSGVGVGVGGADTILQRDAVQPNEQERTVDVLDPNARVTLPPTAWNFSDSKTEAVSPEDIVARQEGWEAIPAFELKPGHQLPKAAVVQDGPRTMARNYFNRAADAGKLADYLTETYEGVQARVRQGRRAKAEGGSSYYFVEIKPEDGFQWPLKTRIKGEPGPKVDGPSADDLRTVDVQATEPTAAAGALQQPTAKLPGAAPAPTGTQALAAPPASTTAPAPAAAPTTSAGKPTGKWQDSPQAPKIQKIIDDLKAAGLEKDAKSVDISSSVDAEKGQLDDARVAKRAKWAAGKIQGKSATVAPRGQEKVQKTAPARPQEDIDADERWTRSTTAERDAWMERAGISKLSRRAVGTKAWKDIGKAAKAKLVAAGQAKADNAAFPEIDTNAIPAPKKESPEQKAVAGVRSRLRKRLGRDAYLLDVAPEPGTPAWSAAKEVAERIFGLKLIPVKQGDGRVFNGIFAETGEVLIDVDSSVPPLAVLGHELLHSMRRDNPALYDTLIRDLVKNSRELATLRKELDAAYQKQGLKKLSENIFLEEFAADVVGDFFTDPKYWRALEARNPSLFKQAADFILAFLDDLYVRLMRQEEFRPFRSDKFIKDLAAARADVVSAIGAYAQSKQGQEADAQPDGPQGELFSLRRTRAAQAVEDMFAEAIRPSKAAMTMNWIITNPVEARGVLKLPSMADQRWVTKRDFGNALDAWRKGKVERDDYSRAAVNKLARALAEEVAWYASYSADSGIDWYGVKFRRAIDKLAEVEPALKSRDGRGLFTLLLAVTSDGTEVQENLGYAMDMFQGFQRGKRLTESTPGQGKYESTYQSNAELIDGLIDDMGLPATIEFLLEPHKVSAIKKEMARVGTKSPASDYPDDAVLPRAAVYIGPKLGAFYANLMGETGYLTMDRWWTRTINRYRGYLTPQPTQSSLDEFRAMTGKTRTSDEKIVELAESIAKARQRKYKAAQADGGFYVASKIETLATTIYKNAKSELNDSPINKDDRAFNIKVVKAAQSLLSSKGIDAAIADIQATIWYYEKELFASIGVRGPDRISYEEAANRWVRERGRSAVRGGGQPDRAAEAADGPQRTGELFSIERDGAGRDQGGGLAPLPGAPTVQGASGPDPRLTAVAEQYARNQGFELQRQPAYVEVDEQRAARIAAAYDAMPHAPQDPAVREAYQNLIQQTRAQYDALIDAGYQFTFFDSKSDPYQGNPWNAMRDLRANQRMAVYGTYDGYGTEGVTQGMVDDNPMLADTGLRWKDQAGVEHPVLANDLFRAVHDAFGHGLEGAGFRARGEENAWQAHVRLFTGSAVAAITTETRGQNSWLNYGPYGERNRTASVEDTVFADQKTGLMPEWTWREGGPDEGERLSVDRVQAKPGVNLKRLAGLLGPQLYGDMKQMPAVALKEMFQNAFDAARAVVSKTGKQGTIAIDVDSKGNRITVADTGTGMTPQILGGPFLQIAGTNKEGDRNSGGFGIAKMQFLFGAEDLSVYTMRDGVLSVLETTGARLMEAMDNASSRPDIQLYRGEEAERMFRERMTQTLHRTGHHIRDWPDQMDSGTIVTIKVPDSFVDPSSGDTVDVKTSPWLGDYDVLSNSPLFADIKVLAGSDGSRWWSNKMGAEFPVTDYTRVFDVKFAWGSASVYVGNETQKYMWGNNVHFLSNGLWQFSSAIKAGDQIIPRYMYVNISSKVKPEEAGYPFQLNRQGLTEMARKDFGKVAQYLAMLYQADTLGESAKRMARIQYLNADGTLENAPDVNPPAQSLSMAAGLDKTAKVEVKDGNLVVNGKQVPVLSAEEMSSARISLSEYKAPEGLIDADRVLFHDNTMVPEGVDKSAEPGTYKDTRKVPFSTWARAKYGDAFDRMNYAMGDIFRRTKSLFMEVFANDPEFKSQVETLSKASVGIGYDTRYYGVHSKIPIHQILINPAVIFRRNAQLSAGQAWMTMLHEFAHLKSMDHGESFNDAEEKIVGDLMFDQDAALLRRDIIDLYQSNLEMLQDLSETFKYVAKHDLAEPAGRSLIGNSEVKYRTVAGRAAGDADPAARAARAQGGNAVGPRGARGGDLDGGEGDLDGGADLLSVDRNIDRPGWDDRTRKALNEPFTGPAKQTITQRLGGLRRDFLRRFVTAVADPFVAIKDVDDKLYMRARLTNGTDGGLEALLHHGQVFDDGGALNVRKGTKGLIAALQPLGPETEDFLRWVALNRAAELKKQDRENFFTDESIGLRNRLVEGKMADGRSRREVYTSVLRDLNALNRSVLELSRKQGLIDQAGFERFSKDIWYVPFYRVAEDNDGDISSYATAAGLSGQDFGKRLKGGKDRVDNLLVNILRNWGGLLAAAQKNGVARDVMEQAVNMGGAMQVKAGTKDAVRVMVDGREKSYLVEDPLLVASLTSINQAALNNPVLNVFGWFKRTLTGAVTIDPAFKIRNLIRDSIQAISLAELPFNPIANVNRGMRSTWDDNRLGALAGGGLFHGHFFGEDDLASKIQRLVETGVPKETVVVDAVDLTKRMMEAYGRGSDRLENANRVALYDAVIARGGSHLEAAYAARDLMDFSLQGRSTAIRMMAMTLPFFNARVQGLYKIGRDGIAPTMLTLMGKANDSQRKQAARFSAVTGSVVMASLMLYLLYKDDEEFQKREAWDRDTFWWFRVGDTAFRVPKPFEVGAIGTMAERALEQLVDDRVGGETFAKAVKDMLVNTFAFDPVPQMLRPMLGIASNEDAFTDRPIETYGMQQLSKTERWGSGTTETAKLLSKGTAAVSTVLPGDNAATLSPAQIDYLARAYFGWLGATIMQSTGALVKWAGPVEAPAMRLDNVAVLGSFVRELPSNQSRYLSEFYKSAEKVSQAWQDIKLYQRIGNIERARELAAENRDLIAMRRLYSSAQEQIASLNRQMRRVTESRDLTPEQKREMLDSLSQRKAFVAQRVELMRRERQMAAS